MKIDFGQSLREFLTDDAIKDGDKPATLGLACINSLLAPDQNDNPTGEEKLRRYHLAMRIRDSIGAGGLDLPVEDLAYIKERMGKTHTVLIYGQVSEMLEGKALRIAPSIDERVGAPEASEVIPPSDPEGD